MKAVISAWPKRKRKKAENSQSAEEEIQKRGTNKLVPQMD
jgi:hypothetical protein